MQEDQKFKPPVVCEALSQKLKIGALVISDARALVRNSRHLLLVPGCGGSDSNARAAFHLKHGCQRPCSFLEDKLVKEIKVYRDFV